MESNKKTDPQTNRRRFLQRASGALATTALGRQLASLDSTNRASALPSADLRDAGNWPMYRGDRRLTGRARLPGELREPPKVTWQYKIEAGEVWEVVDPAQGRRSDPANVDLSRVIQGYSSSPEGRKWGLGPKLVDLFGDEELVSEPLSSGNGKHLGYHGDLARAAKLLGGVPGLQTVEFKSVLDPTALGKGQAVFPPTQAVCYAYDQRKKREVWRSEAYPIIQNTDYCVADVDNDGKAEVAFAPHYRVIVYNGQTGATKQLLTIHQFRNYGFFCCTDLTGNGLLDFVIIANFAMHVDVVKNAGDHLRLLWRHDIEMDIQSKQRIVQPGPNPVLDVNGDGRVEIVFNLFNETGDGRWHFLAYDALTGERVLDLPESYLSGTADVDGDGVPELFVTRTSRLLVPTSGQLRLLRMKGHGTTLLWEHSGGQWAVAPAVLPLSHSIMRGSGIDGNQVVTANLTGDGKRGFFVLSTQSTHAKSSDQFTAYVMGRNGTVAEAWTVSLPARSRLQLRGCTDIDGDGIDEALISHRQQSCTVARTSASSGAKTSVVGLDRAETPFNSGSITNRAVSVDTTKPTLILFEGADDDIVALGPPTRPAGSPILKWRIPGAGPAVLADVNQDGNLEAIFSGIAQDGEGMMVVAEARSGRDVWRRPARGFPGPHPQSNFGGITSWWVGHYTTSRRDDVWVSGRRSTMHSDEAWALRGTDGVELWHLNEVRTNRTKEGTRGWGAGGSFVCSADVDGDGLEDVVSLYPVNYMAAKGTNGVLIHSIEAASGLFPGIWAAYSQPMVADFNGDGKNELLWCGGYHHGLTTLGGDVLWYHPGAASMAGVGDVDRDGQIELGFTGWENGHGLRCLDAATGVQKWELPLEGNPRASVYTAEIDGDGYEEFLFAVRTTLYAVNGKGGAPNVVWRAELPSVPGDLTFSDVDGDGKTEILFIGNDSTLYCLDRGRSQGSVSIVR